LHRKINVDEKSQKNKKGDLSMTYGEIFKEFLAKTKIDGTMINDYRPCVEMYDVPNIDNAIVIWLTDGGKMIYIHKQ